MNKGKTAPIVLALAAVIASWAVHGRVSGLFVWNVLPLPFALLPLLIEARQKGIRYGVQAFTYTIIMTLLAVSIAVVLREGSEGLLTSEARALLIKLPLYAVGAGYATAMLAVVTGVKQEIRDEKEGERP